MTSSDTTPSARAQASRRNGAKSRGPVTAAGKACAARNALKHGLRARAHALLDDEDAAAFHVFETALRAELAPQGVLQAELVARLALAAWRARRADRIEAGVFARYLAAAPHGGRTGDLGAALIRDGNGPHAIETLLRYRRSALAELFRALGALKAPQAEESPQEPGTATLLPPLARESKRTRDAQDFWAPAAGDGRPGAGA